MREIVIVVVAQYIIKIPPLAFKVRQGNVLLLLLLSLPRGDSDPPPVAIRVRKGSGDA